jgi:hypothetical protein
MNGMKFTKAKKADDKKLNIENYPFYNKWMKYYEVYFPHTDSDTLTIVYSNKTEGNTTLKIKKDLYEIK